jgi:hypothetical protein
MGEDKKCEKGKKGCSVTKFFMAVILLGVLVVGGSYAAAKFLNHPEWNLVTKIMGAAEKVEEKVEQKVEEHKK